MDRPQKILARMTNLRGRYDTNRTKYNRGEWMEARQEIGDLKMRLKEIERAATKE